MVIRAVLWLEYHYKMTVLGQQSCPLARVSLVLPSFIYLLVQQNSEEGSMFLIFAKHAMDYCLCAFITPALLKTVFIISELESSACTRYIVLQYS